MTRSRLSACCVAMLAFGGSSQAADQSVFADEIVARYYPVTRLHPAEAGDRRSCHKVVETSDGAPARIVAGYTDTSAAVLVVLQRTAPGTYQSVYESPRHLLMMGLSCDVTLADVDGDSVPDVFLELAAAKGTTAWLFRSTLTGLESLTPVRGAKTAQMSDLNNAGLVDLYHDGTLQVITAGGAPVRPGGRVREAPAVYRVVGEALALDGRPLLVESFQAGDPIALNRRTFEQVAGGTGPYVLNITNGSRGGTKRATAATVTINDTVLSGAAALTEEVEFLDVPIALTLKDENIIEVVVSGTTGAEVTVAIRSRAPSVERRQP